MERHNRLWNEEQNISRSSSVLPAITPVCPGFWKWSTLNNEHGEVLKTLEDKMTGRIGAPIANASESGPNEQRFRWFVEKTYVGNRETSDIKKITKAKNS